MTQEPAHPGSYSKLQAAQLLIMDCSVHWQKAHMEYQKKLSLAGSSRR
jgi:hypothetical protein